MILESGYTSCGNTIINFLFTEKLYHRKQEKEQRIIEYSFFTYVHNIQHSEQNDIISHSNHNEKETEHQQQVMNLMIFLESRDLNLKIVEKSWKTKKKRMKIERES